MVSGLVSILAGPAIEGMQNCYACQVNPERMDPQEAALYGEVLNAVPGEGVAAKVIGAGVKASSLLMMIRNADDLLPSTASKALGHLRIGHAVPWSEMTKAQRKAFQHSYSRHGAELGLSKWNQKNAETLRQQFNSVVGYIRETGTYMGARMKPFNGQSTRVNYYESNLHGTNYYYYETMSGQFVSAGVAR